MNVVIQLFKEGATSPLFVSLQRQSLVFLDIEKAPIPAIKAEYHDRGSLEYEFSSELPQTPLQLMKITNPQAQVGF